MKSRWITYKGKRIFHGDYSNFGFDADGLRKEMQEVINTVCKEPLDSVLAISDVSGTKGSPQNIAILQDVVKKTTPHIKRRAAIGISPIQRVLVDVINKLTGKAAMRVFNDTEEAKNWLVQE